MKDRELRKQINKLIDILSIKGLLTYDEYHFLKGEKYKIKLDDIVTKFKFLKEE